MPKVKSMLKRCSVEVAKRLRTCRYNGSSIRMGEKCLVIFDGPRDRHCYSKETAMKMVEQCKAELSRIEMDLER